MGPLVPETLAAAGRLAGQGVAADVLVVTSPDRLFRAVQARRRDTGDPSWILDDVLSRERAAPLVTVLDGHPHTLAFLAGVHGVPAAHLGVSTFGQSSDLAAAYALHGIDTNSIITAALQIRR
jgi:pyruvate dehydrogenase E1 component